MPGHHITCLGSQTRLHNGLDSQSPAGPEVWGFWGDCDRQLRSWHSYWTAYRLRLQGSDLVIQRTAGTKELSTRIEKRRRGEIGGPLASELVHVTAHSRRELAADRRKKIKVIRRAAHLLPAVIMRPSSLPQSLQRWTLIYLHGMGSSALANYADRPHYFHDGTASVKVIIPTAPSREVSCFDTWFTKTRASKEPSGSKWRLERFNSWYDYTSNHGGRREDTLDLHSLHAMQRALHKIIWREAEELGGRTDRILLGGKSQGCATALDAALTFPKRLGGFVGLVGHLLSCTPVDPGGPQVSTPVPFHFHHEVEDDIMQWDWVQLEEQRLRDAGYQVRSTRSHHLSARSCFDSGTAAYLCTASQISTPLHSKRFSFQIKATGNFYIPDTTLTTNAMTAAMQSQTHTAPSQYFSITKAKLAYLLARAPLTHTADSQSLQMLQLDHSERYGNELLERATGMADM
ncbi:unnamed protein product [Polarella glacialis]|uniref:Phospholipase/carboxylesterase/thioesterase domain-containing protein n=1 Tax=Polarella glacialis TaxID=89957 RepID=A0A813IU50_POLGL|nr:unnamed protein product [Polarella glacialis]